MLFEDDQYLNYYQLQSPPFKWTSVYTVYHEPDFYFLNQKLQKNIVVLYHFIDAREPLVLISAEDGFGKTALINYLNVILTNEKNYKALTIELSPVKSNPDWFLHQLGYALGLTAPYILDEVINKLMEYYLNDSKVIVLIDNDNIFNYPTALENLRALMNIQPAGNHLFTAILTATPLAIKQLETNHNFKSQISRRLDLKAFSQNETCEYIDFNLSRVGRRNPLFTSQACHFIHDTTRGIPLRINLLAQHALNYGAKYSSPLITDELVLKVIPYFLERELSFSNEIKSTKVAEKVTKSETLADFLNTHNLKQILLSAQSEEELIKKLDHIIGKCIFLSFLSSQADLTDTLGSARFTLNQGNVKEALNILKKITLD